MIVHQVKREELTLGEELPVEVELLVDEDNRRFNARLHSAGHLLDVAVRNLALVVTYIIVYRISSPIKAIISQMDPMSNTRENSIPN